jgi:hypothetical protein
MGLPIGTEELAELVSPFCHRQQVDWQWLALMCQVFFVHRIFSPFGPRTSS